MSKKEKKAEQIMFRGEAIENGIDTKILRDLILGVLTNIVAALSVCGVTIPLATDTNIGRAASVLAIVVSWGLAYWYNHNHSSAAKQGQAVTNAIKSAGVAINPTEPKEA